MSLLLGLVNGVGVGHCSMVIGVWVGRWCWFWSMVLVNVAGVSHCSCGWSLMLCWFLVLEFVIGVGVGVGVGFVVGVGVCHWC